jgi:hypothetical protein
MDLSYLFSVGQKHDTKLKESVKVSTNFLTDLVRIVRLFSSV